MSDKEEMMAEFRRTVYAAGPSSVGVVLTDDERVALLAACVEGASGGPLYAFVDTLRGLLERTK